MRLLLGAFGDPGHAFPMLALGSRLVERGHDVTLQTWSKWRSYVEAGGMRFAAAGDYQVFPTKDRPLKPYEAVVHAAREMLPLVEEVAPEVVVADILTLAPALAGEVAGVPVATLIPHVFPMGAPGFPPYALGARLPRTPVGRALWNAMRRPVGAGERQGREELNETRRRLGLPPQERVHGGLVGPAGPGRDVSPARVPPRVGPGPCPHRGTDAVGAARSRRRGAASPVPSRSSSSRRRRRRTRRSGCSPRPCAGWRGRRCECWRPGTADLRRRRCPSLRTRGWWEWISYSKQFPGCRRGDLPRGPRDARAGRSHSGAVVLAVPAGADMGENAARLDWAGLGVRLHARLLSGLTVRLAVERALANPSYRERTASVAAWSAGHDGPTRAAELIEDLGN